MHMWAAHVGAAVVAHKQNLREDLLGPLREIQTGDADDGALLHPNLLTGDVHNSVQRPFLQ